MKDKVHIYASDIVDNEKQDDEIKETNETKETKGTEYFKMVDNQELFFDLFKKHMRLSTDQFKYYRMHSYVFKNLVYGD